MRELEDLVFPSSSSSSSSSAGGVVRSVLVGRAVGKGRSTGNVEVMVRVRERIHFLERWGWKGAWLYVLSYFPPLPPFLTL